ncbi:Periplasmic thiol:disulfide interchange protein DsbA [hydrothermal vent metagenome]|uniref:Periplasmic thiol:disulfide interchange protein DsbA n=1 Tax=hydrothermal vent metagenome TaxID=652676 RepID=A0A3B1CAH9_9ZZZZ
MKKVLVTIAIIIGFVLAVAMPSDTKAADTNEQEINALIKDYIEKHPEVIVESLQKFYDQKRKLDEEASLKESLGKRETIPLGDAPAIGPENARVTLVEFSDFQCPFCAKASITVQNLIKKYDKDLRVVFKHLPLAFHSKAEPASKAAMAANEQGKFWPYRDLLLEKQNEWGNGDEQAFFITYAKDLGLDIERFKKDIKNKTYQTKIDKDKALAKKLGISGTPTFFVNGVKIRGAVPQARFEKVIEMLLNEKS